MVVKMTIYFVSNNLVVDNIMYETDEGIEEKRINRPLSIEGEKLACQIAKVIDGDVLYSSSYSSSIDTAKYYSRLKNIDIKINSFLNDGKVGDLGSRNIKMLRFMQERDFDFKFKHGESLNEVAKRINIAIDRIIKQNGKNNLVIFTQKRAILAYLLDKLDHGFNLDDRLILEFRGKVIIDDVEEDADIIKVTLEKGVLVDCEVINL